MGKTGSKEQSGKIPADQLNWLLENSRYNKRELKQIYKRFSTFVTNGNMSKDQFIDIYLNCSNSKNISVIAEHIFRTCDVDENQSIDFTEFIACLSVTTRGTLMEQIKWIFSLYDINRDGVIECEEVLEVLKAVETLGVKQDDTLDIQMKFNEMDTNKDGMLSQNEFVNGCLDDTTLLRAIGLLK
jgi:Ca2+-binding EF-hand superfamily protein